MRLASLALFPLAACMISESSMPPPPPVCRSTSPIIGGDTSTPAQLREPEARAIAAIASGTRTFCSGTLVGDRLVLTATHCVLGNPEEWLEGAAPIATSPVGISVAFGRDASQPDCRIPAQSIEVNPDAALRTAPSTANLHDFAVIVLGKPASTECPGVVPLAVALDPLPDLSSAEIFEGGFGGTDPSTMTPTTTERHWAIYAGATFPGALEVVAQFAGTGTPWFGDSGSSLLVRDGNGFLRVIGVVSNFDDTGGARASRTDAARAWFEPFLAGEAGCGAFAETCVDNLVVTCTPSGAVTSDCGPDATCTVEGGGPVCVPRDDGCG